jgi:hypothetical protein
MTDETTKKPIRVWGADTPWPCLSVPFIQLDEVRRFLDKHGVSYWVSDRVISINGGPEMASINFYRGADAAAIQAVLDKAP